MLIRQQTLCLQVAEYNKLEVSVDAILENSAVAVVICLLTSVQMYLVEGNFRCWMVYLNQF